MIHTDGIVIAWNRKMEELTGVTPGKTAIDIRLTDHSFLHLIV